MREPTTLTSADITALLEALRAGDVSAADRLFPVVYDVLHDMAARQLRHERPDHTLQPTILIHDAWLRLAGERDTPWTDRAHFFTVAARAMRRLLVDHARERRAGKRRRDLAGALPEELPASTAPDPLDLIALDAALDALATIDDRVRRVVELRFFGGLEWTEIAAATGTSERTAKRDWRFARAWLRRAMDAPDADADDP